MPPKITYRSKTSVNTLPEKPAESKQPNQIEKAFAKLKTSSGEPLTAKELTTLQELQFASGGRVFAPDRPGLILEIAALLRRYTFPAVVDYLRNSKTGRQAIIDSPLLENEHNDIQSEIDNIQKEIEITPGTEKCPGCGSLNVLSTQKQIRSADEGMSTLYHCLACSRGWRVD